MEFSKMTRRELIAEIERLKCELDEIEAAQPQTREGATIIRKLQKLEGKSKDRWDKAQILLGTLLLPFIIALVGLIASNDISKAQLKASDAIAQAQLKSSKQIAQNQLTKDYISILSEAVSKPDDKQLMIVLDSLAALKETELGIPPVIKGILVGIKIEPKSQRVLQAVSQLVSSEDEDWLEGYFKRND